VLNLHLKLDFLPC